MTPQDLSCFCLQPWLVVSETLFWDIHICLDCYKEEQLHFSQAAAKIKARPQYLPLQASLKNANKLKHANIHVNYNKGWQAGKVKNKE